MFQEVRITDMSKRLTYERLEPMDLSPEGAGDFERQIAEADEALEETRVNFRWGKEQLDMVKRAAEMIGVPYQTFLKLAVYERALEVLKGTKAAKSNDAA